MCWGSDPDARVDWNVRIGTLSMRGPIVQDQECVFGVECIITVAGVGLTAENAVLIAEASANCAEEVPYLHRSDCSSTAGAADGVNHYSGSTANSRNPRHFDTIEGGRVSQALHIDSKSLSDALCRVKKCFGHSI